jgi:N-acetylglutamate synthase-like GNAT family acetyltransferase
LATDAISVKVKSPQSDEEFAQYYGLRWRVLRAPWGSPRGSERDELETEAHHAMICGVDGNVLAVGRLHFNSPDEGQIRYMAVDEQSRGQGHGRRIVEYLEAEARAHGARAVMLNAREQVVGFYAVLGYEVVGEGPTMFGTVKHSKMRKKL